MKIRQMLSGVLMALGIGCLVLALWAVSYGVRSHPTFLQYPVNAEERAESLMNAVCSGSYDKASEYLYGTPNLGAPTDDSTVAVNLVWEAFLDSLEYEFVGGCSPEESGVSIEASLRFLNVSSAIGSLDTRAQELLNQRIQAAKSSEELYDENNEYRQEIIDQVLRDATLQVLEENQDRQERTITLHLVYEDGQWWVFPEADLLGVLSGAISG